MKGDVAPLDSVAYLPHPHNLEGEPESATVCPSVPAAAREEGAGGGGLGAKGAGSLEEREARDTEPT